MNQPSIILWVIVFQISPPRMGSTWQFNTAKMLMQLQNTPLKSAYVVDISDLSDFKHIQKESFLIKSHSLDPKQVMNYARNSEVMILLSLRNLFDTVRSSRRVFKEKSDIEHLDSIAYTLNCLKGLVDLKIPCHLTYIDQMISEDDSFQETVRILDFLGLKATSEQIAQISKSLSKNSIRDLITNELKLGENFHTYDKDTLWHGNHISEIVLNESAKFSEFQLVPQEVDFGIGAEINRLMGQVENLKDFLLPYGQLRIDPTQ